jgi:NAD(P)-dependent dehydrogenase (short-subunit alcohol dehydrogenase family)
VRVNTTHPGFIFTGMTQGHLQRNEFRDGPLKRTPIGRIGDPQDTANGVLHLASDESSFVSGTELAVDGGFLAV